MEYRRLGSSGLKVSALSYGAWVTFNQNQVAVPMAKEIMTVCKDAGVNFFDNAEVYANGEAETIMGQAIKELYWKRSEYVISTKIFWGGRGPNESGLSRKHLIEGTKASLQRLQLDYVDLLYAHRPDPNTPIEETVRAFNWIIDQGWALYWGTSEWSAEQLQQAFEIADRLDLIGPTMEQPEYNMFERQKVESDYLPLYQRGLGLTTWSPLASGVLTGKYSGGVAPPGSRLAQEQYKGMAQRKLVEKAEQLAAVEQLKPIAEQLECSQAQLALAWCARNPNVSSVITGATKVEQVRENLAAIAVVPKLTDDIMAQIEAIIKSKPAALAAAL